MHTAYRVHQLLKLPLTIEYIRAFDDSLLVGTREGHLLMYSVKVLPRFTFMSRSFNFRSRIISCLDISTIRENKAEHQ